MGRIRRKSYRNPLEGKPVRVYSGQAVTRDKLEITLANVRYQLDSLVYQGKIAVIRSTRSGAYYEVPVSQL